jgi:hypothetical protein
VWSSLTAYICQQECGRPHTCLPGTRYLYSSGAAKQLRASRRYLKSCPEIGSFIAELACSSLLLTERDDGAVRQGSVGSADFCKNILPASSRSLLDSAGAGSLFLRNVGVIYQATRRHTLEHTNSCLCSCSFRFFVCCPINFHPSALYFSVVLILFIYILNNSSADTYDS